MTSQRSFGGRSFLGLMPYADLEQEEAMPDEQVVTLISEASIEVIHPEPEDEETPEDEE